MTISTGDASDDVSLGRTDDGRITVDVSGQALDGATPAGCTWDPDAEELACAPSSVLDVELGGGDDTFDGGDVPVLVNGGAGNDTIDTGAAGSTVIGGDGDDALSGGDGADTISGDAGRDTIDAGAGDDRVDGGAGDDVIDGGGGADDIRGGAGNDQIDGTSGDDHVSGEDGADTISPGTGASQTSGGAGDDTIDLSGATGGSATGDDGDDVVDASAAVAGLTLDGGTGNDAITGSPGTDHVSGGPGDDVLDGGPGADVLAGGDGFDRVVYDDSGAVTVTVGTGADDGHAGEGDDVQADVDQVDGTSDDDTLVAGPAGTVLNGLDGDDHLVGGAGADHLLGGPGRDRLDGGSGTAPDVFQGGADVDEVSYAARTEPLMIDLSSRAPISGAVGEHDVFLDAVENVVGGSGDDHIVGQPGVTHRIESGPGDDTIVTRELPSQEADAAPDGIGCGDGNDVVSSDRFDVVSVTCERVEVDGYLRRPEMIFGRGHQGVTVARRGGVSRVRVGCDHATRGYCATRVLLRAPGASVDLARREVRIMPGKTLTVRVPALSRERARRLSRRSRILVVVAARDKVGNGSISKLLLPTRRG